MDWRATLDLLRRLGVTTRVEEMAQASNVTSRSSRPESSAEHVALVSTRDQRPAIDYGTIDFRSGSLRSAAIVLALGRLVGSEESEIVLQGAVVSETRKGASDLRTKLTDSAVPTDAERWRFLSDHLLTLHTDGGENGYMVHWCRTAGPGEPPKFYPVSNGATAEEAVDRAIERYNRKHGLSGRPA